jgi:hypothetical protein
MFENEIKFISDFTLNKAKDLGTFFTIEKFLSTDIHPAIKKYVEGEINYLIQQDRKKLIDNSLFDYSGAKIANYFNLIADEIKKTKKVSFEDIKKIILQAVSFNANYVVRPKWALSKLIFGNNRSVDYSEVQLMLNYTYYYEYLNSVFLAYMSKKKIMNISVTEFELIMNKIDRELFVLHQSKLVDNALYAIADFYNIGGLNRSTLTVEAIENFLKEKNLTELLFKLKRGFPNPSRKKIEIEDIRKVLYSAFPLDVPLMEEEKVPSETENEKHFDNPLKELSVTAEESEESTSEVQSESTTTPTEEKKYADEIFEEEKDSEILNDLVNETENEHEQVQRIDESSSSFNELAASEIDETLNNVMSKENVEEQNEPQELEIIPDYGLSTGEEIKLEGIQEETEEEIIIVDEKEENNLLNFFDDELEIAIDDKVEIQRELTSESEHEDESSLEIKDIKFENESEQPKEIEIEKESAPQTENIEFEQEIIEEVITPPEEPVKTEEEEVGYDLRKPKIPKLNEEDIFSHLSKKEIDRIIKNLFNSDSEDFANTVERMSSCDTVEDALEILNNILKYARIKPHNKDAVSLGNAIRKYFKQDN